MATGTLGPILCLEDATQAADGGSFSATGTDIFVRYHNAQYNNQPAWRFVIPASVYDDMVAGTGVISASITMRVYINNLNGTPQGGQIRLSPDPGAFSGSGRPNDIWNHANATASVATTVPNVSAGTDVVSADLSAALDGLLPNLTYDAGVDGYIFGAIHRPTSGVFAYFVRIYTLESGSGNNAYAGRLTATYDAPVTNAEATPAAAVATAEGGVGYFQWADLNYDRDGSRSGNNFRRYLDVYEPWTVDYDDSAGRRAVVYIHGGAYYEGNENTLTNDHATAALARGYTVVAVRYSLSDQDEANNDNDYSHPMAVQDLGMALTWLTDSDGNNSPSGAPEGIAEIDPDWLVLEGYSAGGHLALGYALTYDDQTVYQWDYAGGGTYPRRDAEPSTSPDFTFTQGRTNQPRPRALYLWDPPIDIQEAAAYNGVLAGPLQAFYGGNADGATPYSLDAVNGEGDYNDLIDGAAERPGGYWDGNAHGYRLHGMPIGYTEARWGSGRWAPPIRNYGDPGETVNYRSGIEALEDALENIGYPTNTTGTGAYQPSIFNGNGATGLNEDGGLSHWQHGGYTTIPSFPHDVVYIYDDFTTPTWPWQTWHTWLEASESAYPVAATAAATGGTVSVATEGGGNNDVTLTAASAAARVGWTVGNTGQFEWTSIVDGADEDPVTSGEYQFDLVVVAAGGTVTVDETPAPPPGRNKWVRHRYPAGGSSTAYVRLDLGTRPSHPDGYYPSHLFTRYYFRVASIPTVDVFIGIVDGAYQTGALYGVKLKTTGALVITDQNNIEVGTISGGAISPNTTYRLEAAYAFDGSLGTGDEVEHRLYELHSTTPIGSVTTDTQADYVSAVDFGYFTTGNPGTDWDLWTAEHAAGSLDGGWIGPVEAADDAVTLTAASSAATGGSLTADAVTDAAVTIPRAAAHIVAAPTADPMVATYTPSGWLNGDKSQAYIEAAVDDLRAAGLNTALQAHWSPSGGDAGASWDATGNLYTRPGDADVWTWARNYDADLGLYIWLSVHTDGRGLAIGDTQYHATAAADLDAWLDAHPEADGVWLDVERFDEYDPADLIAFIGAIRTARPGVWIGVNAPAAPTGNAWTDGQIASVTAVVDAVSPMVYDYSATPGQDRAGYLAWVEAVAERYELHSAAGAALIPSAPTHNVSGDHDPTVENLRNAYDALRVADVELAGVAAYWWAHWNNNNDDSAETLAMSLWLTGNTTSAEATSGTGATPSAAPATALAGTVTVANVSDDTAGPSSATAAATAHGSATAVTDDAVTLTAATAVVTATAGTVDAGSDREAQPAAASAPATAGTIGVEASSAGQALPAAAVASTLPGTVTVATNSNASTSPSAAFADTRPPPSITPTVTVADAVTLTAATAAATGGTTTAEADTDADVTLTAATAVAQGRGGAAGLTVDTGSSTEAAPTAATAAATAAGPTTTVADAVTLTAAATAASGQTPAVDASSSTEAQPAAASAPAIGRGGGAGLTVDTDSGTEATAAAATSAATAGTVTVDLEQNAAQTLIRALANADGGTVAVTVDGAVTLTAATATATGQTPTVDSASASEALPAAAVAVATAAAPVVDLVQDAAALPSAALAEAAAGANLNASTILLAILRRYRRPTMHQSNAEPGSSA